MQNIKEKEIKENKNEESIIDSSRSEHFVPSNPPTTTCNNDKIVHVVKKPRNRLVELPDDIYYIVNSFLPRYVPDVSNLIKYDNGITSDNIMTLGVINDVYIHHCNQYSMDASRIVRDQYFALNYTTPQNCLFNEIDTEERAWLELVFGISLKRTILNREIESFKFPESHIQNEELFIDLEKDEKPQSSKLSIITLNDEEMIYESDGPMSPIQYFEDSIHRIFCDRSCDEKQAVHSFQRTYLSPLDTTTQEDKILQEEIPEIFCCDKEVLLDFDLESKPPSESINLEEELFKYKSIESEPYLYGEFLYSSEHDYGMFQNISPRNRNIDLSKFVVQAESESYTSKFFTHYFFPHLSADMLRHFKDLDADYIPKLFDDIITFVQMSTQKIEGYTRYETIYLAVRVFLKCRYNESTVKTLFSRVGPFVKNLFKDLSVQADFFETSRGFLNSYKNINESPIVIKLYKCCMFLLSMSIFDKFGINFETFGYTKLEEVAIKKRMYKKTDFMFVLCDTILFIVERGYQVYLTGDINCLFHSGGTYKNLYDDCRELTRQKDQLCNPEANGFTESDFRGRLDVVIEKLTNIEKHSFRLDKTDVKMIKLTLNDMLMIRDDLNTKTAARSNREAPIGLLIFGDSGIGKTTITNMLCTYFAKHENLPCGEAFRYTVNPAAKYWDGFVTSQHTVILDDIANEDPSLGDPKSLNVVIQVMNNQAYCPDQASLEMKGTTPFRGKLVVATTNVKNLNAYHYFSCPSAVQRRFPFIITPVVKPEFKDERGMLNSSNVPNDVAYPDLWYFKVELVRPVSISKGKHYANVELIHDNLNIKELLIWFDGAINKFNEDQRRVQNCVKLIQETNLCFCCNLPDNLCNVKPQGILENCTFGIFSTLFFLYLNFIRYYLVMITSNVHYKRLVLFYRFYTTMNRNIAEYKIKLNDIYRKSYDKEMWERVGNTMYNKMKQPEIFIPLASIVSMILISYKTYKKMMPQGDVSEEVGTRPIEELMVGKMFGTIMQWIYLVQISPEKVHLLKVWNSQNSVRKLEKMFLRLGYLVREGMRPVVVNLSL
jgi:hypothetical protein